MNFKKLAAVMRIGLTLQFIFLWNHHRVYGLNYSLFLEGDIVIGSLFPIFNSAPDDFDKCADTFAPGQALVVYSIVYAAHKINAYSDILRNIRVGLNIKPTCSDPVIALIESIKFIDPGPGPRQGYNLSSFEVGRHLDSSQTFKEIQYGSSDINFSNSSDFIMGYSPKGPLYTYNRRPKRDNDECGKDSSKAHNYVLKDVAEHQGRLAYIRNLFGTTRCHVNEAHPQGQRDREKSIVKRQVTPQPTLVLSNFLRENTGTTPITASGVTRPINIPGAANVSQNTFTSTGTTTRFKSPLTVTAKFGAPIIVTNSPSGFSQGEILAGFSPTPQKKKTLATTTTLGEAKFSTVTSFISEQDLLATVNTIEVDPNFMNPHPGTMSEQERITLQATLNFMNKEPEIKALIEGLGNSAKIVSPLLSSYQIPQISYKNSDDNLANKMFYPFLLRFAVSNRVYVSAILSLLQYFNWNYVNILYQDDDNSENLYEVMKAELNKANMCTFVETRLDALDTNMKERLNNFTSAIFGNRINITIPGSSGPNSRHMTSNMFDTASLALTHNVTVQEEVRSKVVITFLTKDKIIKMFKYLGDSSNGTSIFRIKDLIFIGVYTWPSPLEMELEGLHHTLNQISCLYFQEIKGKIWDYLIWFRTFAVHIFAKEPMMNSYKEWIKYIYTNHSDLVERHTVPRVNSSKLDDTPENTKIGITKNLAVTPTTSIPAHHHNISNNQAINDTDTYQQRLNAFIWNMEQEIWGLEIYKILESMDLLAQALDKLKWKNCPNAKTPEEFNKCFQGEDIYNELNNLISEKKVGNIEENHGTLALKNLRDSIGNSKIFQEIDVGFFYLNTLIITEDIEVTNSSFRNARDAPLSICSLPCPSKHYKIYKSNLCCWECAKCQVNEILTNDKDKPCALCPKFFWPDPETQSICREIEPQTLRSYTFTYYVIPVLQIIGLFAWALLLIFFIKNFNHPAMLEMGRLIIILFIIGIFFGLIAHFNYFGNPAKPKCTMCYFLKYGSAVLFCAGILAELSTSKSFVMRNRDMTEIFRNELTLYERRRQWIVALAVIVVQIILSILLFNLFPIYPVKEQVTETLRDVLVYCPAKTPNMAFNIIQIAYLILLLLISIYLVSREQSLLRISSALRYLSFCIYISLFLCVMMLPINFSMKSFLSRIMFDFVLFFILNVVFLLFLADFAIFRVYTIRRYQFGSTSTGQPGTTTGLGHLGNNPNKIGTVVTTLTRNAALAKGAPAKANAAKNK